MVQASVCIRSIHIPYCKLQFGSAFPRSAMHASKQDIQTNRPLFFPTTKPRQSIHHLCKIQIPLLQILVRNILERIHPIKRMACPLLPTHLGDIVLCPSNLGSILTLILLQSLRPAPRILDRWINELRFVGLVVEILQEFGGARNSFGGVKGSFFEIRGSMWAPGCGVVFDAVVGEAVRPFEEGRDYEGDIWEGGRGFEFRGGVEGGESAEESVAEKAGESVDFIAVFIACWMGLTRCVMVGGGEGRSTEEGFRV